MGKLCKTTLRAGLAAIAFGSAGMANAAVITRTFNVTATSFTDLRVIPAPLPPPVPIVFGSFTITFDDAVTATDQLAGIFVNSLNLPLDAPVSFNYQPGIFLGIGSTVNGSAVGFGGSLNDFGLRIENPTSMSPLLTAFAYTVPSTNTGADLGRIWVSQTGTVTLGNNGTVPEPTTWALMLAGFGLMGGMLRRRGKQALRTKVRFS